MTSPQDDDELRQLVVQSMEAWNTIRARLISAPMLIYPDFSKPFKFYVDGSKEWGFGIIIYQISRDNIKHPIVYLSKVLSLVE